MTEQSEGQGKAASPPAGHSKTVTKIPADEANPASLLAAPDGRLPDPPADTSQQLLPFEALSWKDFERLCLRLAGLGGTAEHWQLYGVEGQAQAGIDIYVRIVDSAGYESWQAKHYAAIKPAHIDAAVRRFLNGSWAAKSSRFVFCTSSSLERTELADAIEKAARTLGAADVAFTALGAYEISAKLKDRPEIVDDFFGREWVRIFCGASAAQALGDRLSREDFGQFRERLESVYQKYFDIVDPGMLSQGNAIGGLRKVRPLAERFIVPDLTETGDRQFPALETEREETIPGYDEWGSEGRHVVRRPGRARSQLLPQSARISLEHGLSQSDRSIILGAPGAGKSTLLRFIALDLLAGEPRLAALKRRWPTHVPLLFSFPFWTRQIANGVIGAAAAIPATIAAWFEQNGEPGLAGAAKAAFERRDVLLLVDGVDEWADETAAATALTLLQTFAATHDIPVIMTSRPHGARLLGPMDSTWKRFTLAPFSLGQQTDFAASWFSFLEAAQYGSAGDARLRAKKVVSDLQQNTEIATLAAVPLLLGGLIALAHEGARLPRNRFEAYGELIDRMMRTQPDARARAALAPGPSLILDDYTRELAFCALAFGLQARGSRGERLDALDRSEAVALCAAFLCDHLSYDAATANEQARALLASGAETIGILVEKSPKELGFFHRAFQERLAAKHIESMPLDRQCELMRSHGNDPRWRDVLLFVAQSTGRPEDVAALIIAAEQAITDTPDNFSAQVLLAELAFSKVKRSAKVTSRLAETLLGYVETGSEADVRAQILEIAVAGLQYEQTGRLLRTKIPTYFPQYARYGDDLLDIVAKWDEPEIDDILWRNLEAEDEPMRRKAAEVLARRHAGDETWREKICDKLQSPPDVETAAAALRLLDLGWRGIADTDAIVDLAAGHSAPALRVAAIEARIARGVQSEDDRDYLLGLNNRVDWRLTGQVPRLLGCGWPSDTAVRKLVVKYLAERRFELDKGLEIIAAGMPGDVEFSRQFAEHVGEEGLQSMHNGLRLLASAFPGDAALADILIGHCHERTDRPYYHFHIARVAATPLVRQRLIDDLAAEKSLRFWAVNALLDHWPEEPQVREALQGVLAWSAEDQSSVADRLAEILPADLGQVKRMLWDLLGARGEDVRLNVGNIVQGLFGLGELADPAKAAKVIAKLDAMNPDAIYVDSAYAALMQLGPENPDIVGLAQKLLHGRNNMVAVIALCLADDAGIRKAVLEMSAPLPLPLRIVIAQGLAAQAGENMWALEQLDRGRFDGETGLGAHCFVEATRLRKLAGKIDEPYLAILDAEIRAVGPHYQGRRLAGIFAMAIAGELARGVEGIDPQMGLRFGLSPWHTEGWIGLDQHVAEFFSSGEARAAMATRSREILSDEQVVGRLGTYVDLHPELIPFIETTARHLIDEGKSPVAAYAYLMRAPANRDLVRDGCLALLGDGQSWSDMRVSLSAADLLARHFSGDARLLQDIVSRYEQGHVAGPIAALCDGWPDCDFLEQLLAPFREKQLPDPLGSNPALFMKLFAVKASPEGLVSNFAAMAREMEGDVWDGTPFWSSTVVRRIREDSETADAMMDRLEKSADPNEKLSFASFLAAALGLTPELAKWCREELAKRSGDRLAESGMDLWIGRPVLISQRLKQILAPQSG